MGAAPLSLLHLTAAAGADAGPGLAVRAALVVALLGTASVAWWLVHRRRRFRPASAHGSSARLSPAELGISLGTRATFVQFSSATCATCPQVRRSLSGIAATEPGVEHVDLLAEDHMGLVRRFAVYRTPTVLLLDPTGAVSSRSSGSLTTPAALAALADHDRPRGASPATDPLRSIDA